MVRRALAAAVAAGVAAAVGAAPPATADHAPSQVRTLTPPFAAAVNTNENEVPQFCRTYHPPAVVLPSDRYDDRRVGGPVDPTTGEFSTSTDIVIDPVDEKDRADPDDDVAYPLAEQFTAGECLNFHEWKLGVPHAAAPDKTVAVTVTYGSGRSP